MTAGNTSAFAEVKLLVNKSEQVRAGEREFQTKMAQKTPTKPVNTKICRCCCKPLGPNDHPISLFGEKSQREAIMEGYHEITGLEGNENDGLPQFVCRSCARKIAAFQEFKTLCRASDDKQRASHSESGNTRVKRGKKLEETPPGPTISPSVSHISKKTRPDHIAKPPAKIRLACRFQYTNTSTAALVPIARRPVVQTMQHSDKDSTLSRADDKTAHNEKECQESTDTTRNLPEFLKPKAVDKASVDRKQGVDILSTSGLHKNTVRYKLPSFLYTSKRRGISSYVL